MMKQLRLLFMLLLCAVVNGVWGQSDYSAIYTNNVSLSGGTSCKVKISDVEYNGTKLGSSGNGGSCTFSAPAGTKYIHIHVAAWNGKSPTFSYKIGSGSEQNLSITSNSGIAGNSPFTFSGDPSSASYYKVVTLDTPLASNTTVTLKSTSERCVIWGVNTEELPSYTLTAESNDNALGTVEVSGNKITGTPASNCRYASPAYTVTVGSATVSQSGNVFSVTASADCTVRINFEAIPTHTLSYAVSPAGAGAVELSGTTVYEGATATATASANAGYKFVDWSISGTGAELSSTTDNPTTITMGTSNAVVTANFEAVITYEINYNVNGSIVKTENVEKDEAVDLSAPTSGIPEGYVFKGWVIEANKIDIPTDTDPGANYVTEATSTANITYYAVMAIEIPSVKTQKVDELTRETTGVSNNATTYSSWSGKTATSDAIYAGNSAGSNNSIQLRSTDSSGIISTTSGGKVKKVVVEWNNNTVADRTLDIYVNNSAYTATSDLYNSSKYGTKAGSIVKGTSSELVIDGDYTFVGMRSNKNAMYLSKISITWEEQAASTYSNYCTTVPTATTTIAAACTDGEGVYYGTYSNTSAFVVPSDLVVSEIGIVDGKLYVEDYSTGDIVPANTGVMISSDEAGAHTLTLAAGGTSVLGTDNKLKATGSGITAEAMAAANTGCKFYRLTMHNGTTLGFYWGAENGGGFAVGANKAYLAIPTNEAKSSFTFGEDITAISNLNINDNLNNNVARYNLSGQRVDESYKGIVIVNGKKYINK